MVHFKNQVAVLDFLNIEKPEVIIDAAARVGVLKKII